MAKVAATAFRLYFNTGSESEPFQSAWACETTMSLEINQDTNDVTCKESDWKATEPTKRGFTLSGTAWFDDADNTTHDALVADIMAGSKTKFECKTIDGYKYSGTVVLTSVSIQADDGSHLQVTLSGTGDGTLTRAAA